jgi:HTH-type transcriptional regulator/antitoxin HigA
MNINELIEHWKHISLIIRAPQSTEDYNQLANVLDQLLDIIKDDESHELMGLVDIISYMISMYDEPHDY